MTSDKKFGDAEDDHAETWRRHLAGALNGARSRSRRSSRPPLPFDLTLAALCQMMTDQHGQCAITGLPFRNELYPDALVKRPFAPSVDRVRPAGGYVIGNVRLICTAANFAKNQWSDTVLRRIAHGVVDTERRRERAWFQDMKRKIRQAERKAVDLTGAELERQKRVIAGLKATVTKGPARLAGAAIGARLTRQAK